MDNSWEELYQDLNVVKEKDCKTNKEIYEIFRQDHFLGSMFYKPFLRELGISTKSNLDIPFLRELGLGGVEKILDIDYPYCQDTMDIRYNEKKSKAVLNKVDNENDEKNDTSFKNINNSVIIQGNNSVGNITLGDASYRQEDALIKINFEIKTDFSELAKSILVIESLKPEPFWDIRKVNETEQSYQSRAENKFLKYKELFTSEISKNKYSRHIYISFKNQISDKNILEKLENIFTHFEEVVYYMHSYGDFLNHLLKLGFDDKRRHSDCLSKHREIITVLKMQLLEAAGYYFELFNGEIDSTEVLLSLSTANICVDITPNKKLYYQCRKRIAEYAAEKVEILQERLRADKNSREISSDICDPYIVMLRKNVGLSEELSAAEIHKLKNSDIDMDETDALKLFKLAAFSYIELDGEASVIYFKRLLEVKDISQIQKIFVENSLHRLENPDFYQGALGVMVIDVKKNGGLERAGVQAGDVIISINGQPFLEPFDLSAALASEKEGTPILLKLVRNKMYWTITINAGESAGAVLSQLVIYSLFQL